MKLVKTSKSMHTLDNNGQTITITRDPLVRTATIDGRPYDIDRRGVVFDSINRTENEHGQWVYPQASEEITNLIYDALDVIHGK